MRLSLLVLVIANLLFMAWGQAYLKQSRTGGEQWRISSQIKPEQLHLLSAEEFAAAHANMRLSAATAAPDVGDQPALAAVDQPAAAAAGDAATQQSAAPTAQTEVAVTGEAVAEAVVTEAAAAKETQKEAAVVKQAPPPEAAAAPTCRRVEWLSADSSEMLKRAITAIPRLIVDLDQRPQPMWVALHDLPDKAQAEERMKQLRALGVEEMELVAVARSGQYAISFGIFQDPGNATELQEQLYAKGVKDVRTSRRKPLRVEFAVELRASADDIERALNEFIKPTTSVNVKECQKQ